MVCACHALALPGLMSGCCAGLSLKTQFLYAVVFVTRYLDLLYNFSSLYNSVMKVIFISTSIAIVYLMKFKAPYCETYDKGDDNFYLPYIVVPCALLSLVINEYFS